MMLKNAWSRVGRSIVTTTAVLVGISHASANVHGAEGVQQTWSIEPTIWIRGVTSAAEHSLFRTVPAIGADGDGNIYTFDRDSQLVRRFTPAGAESWSFGGRGRLPGQFQNGVGMAVSRRGDVWVVDPGNQRYAIIRDGQAHVFRRDATTWATPWWGGVAGSTLYDPINRAPGGGDELLPIDTAGHPGDTIPLGEQRLPIPRRGSIEFPLPFSPRLLHAFDPRGFVWSARSDSYRIVEVSWKGDTLARASRPYRAGKLTPSQVDSATRYAQSISSAMQVDVDSNMIPRVMPLLQWIAVDDRGWLWVSVKPDERSSEIDVFDSSGRYKAHVQTSLEFAGIAAPVIRGNKFYAVVRDSAGIAVIGARINGRE